MRKQPRVWHRWQQFCNREEGVQKDSLTPQCRFEVSPPPNPLPQKRFASVLFCCCFWGFYIMFFGFLCWYFVLISARVCAPPHAAVRGGVPTVRLPLDEQPPDEGAAAAVHNQTVGHVSGAITHRARRYRGVFFSSFPSSFWLCRRF